jgi:tetratricopeptide (TPR) repeat protein
MNRLPFLAVLFVFLAFSSAACVNEYHTKLDGSVTLSDGGPGRIMRETVNREQAREKAIRLLEAYRNPVDPNTPLNDRISIYSDYGVQLIYLGEYEKAKRVYREIERLSPDRYRTASNLGTVYELLGQNDSALIWIRKAVALNPHSHGGSEWIHIKILKYKLRGETKPGSSLLGVNFGTEELPSNPYRLDLRKLSEHLQRQLKERTKLVPPKDPVVGRLYFDLGNITAQTFSAEAALPYYKAALEYGHDTPLLQTRIAAMEDLANSFSLERTIHENRDKLREYFWLIVVLGSMAFVGGVLIARRIVRKIRRCVRAKKQEVNR